MQNNEPTVIGENATLFLGDSMDVLKTLPENSIEACLTDPPYGLSQHSEADIRKCMASWLEGKEYVHGGKGFMGRIWDSFVPGPELWRELYRVLKPGAHLLVFAGTRTADLMSMALRLAGFECRENVLWVHSQGFPKAADCGKLIDAHLGKEREVVGKYSGPDGRQYAIEERSNSGKPGWGAGNTGFVDRIEKRNITAPASPEATQWDGWKSSLKPSYEPILLFRKPLDGTIAENVLKHGCGGLNVDACRVGDKTETHASKPRHDRNGFVDGFVDGTVTQIHNHGRFPSNLIIDSSKQVEKCFPDRKGWSGQNHSSFNPYGGTALNSSNTKREGYHEGYNDDGSASRFFQRCDYTIEEIAEINEIELKRIVYCAKASKSDRNQGCESLPIKRTGSYDGNTGRSGQRTAGDGITPIKESSGFNNHPTCKPSSLLRYLLRMVVPPGATVIDPFFGSGSTGKAALLEGFKVIGIEREPEYFEIAKARCAYVSPEQVFVKPVTSNKPAANAQPNLFEFGEAA